LIFIPYLWLTGRRRAATVALATFSATVAIGFAALPQDAARYWWRQVAEPGDGPQRLVNQSLRGALLRMTHHGSGDTVLWLTVAIAVGVIGLTVAVAASRRGFALLGICLCGATGLLVSPVSWSHHWVYVVPALALMFDQRLSVRVRAIWASVLVVLFAWWPTSARGPSGLLRLAPHDAGRELRWNSWQLAYGDYYVLAALAFVIGTAIMLAHSSPRLRPAVAVT
jgi:alpha-1,2-mannosyltransferase